MLKGLVIFDGFYLKYLTDFLLNGVYEMWSLWWLSLHMPALFLMIVRYNTPHCILDVYIQM